MQSMVSTARPPRLIRASGAEISSPPPLPPDSDNKQKQYALSHTPLKVNASTSEARTKEKNLSDAELDTVTSWYRTARSMQGGPKKLQAAEEEHAHEMGMTVEELNEQKRLMNQTSCSILSAKRDARAVYDALDRFGTRLEKRFSKKEIISLMKKCNLHSIEFSKSTPFYVALGYKK